MPNQIKQNILNEISAIKILNSGFPNLNISNSFSSFNSQNNPLSFLLDLIKTFIGFEEFKNDFINFLVYNLNPIDKQLKTALKKLLKSTFSCNIDGIIPNYFITQGLNISIAQIDLFNLFKINPTSTVGKLVYSNQDDLNKTLYNAIVNGSANWKNIITITFLENATVEGELKNNVLNIKINPIFNNKTINDFINQFVDSIQIIEINLILNKILDLLYGIFSNVKSINDLKKEEETYRLINKIINLPEQEIDESYYIFNTNDINNINENSNRRKQQSFFIKTCGDIESKIDINDISDLNTQLNNSSTLIDKKTVITNKLDTITQVGTQNVNNQNKESAKFDLFQNFFSNLITAIVSQFISPKIILLFTIYFKIANLTIGFKTAKEFIEENLNFFISLIKDIILPIIIKYLLEKILKFITELIIQDNVNRVIEQTKNYKRQLFSLFGINDVLNNIL